MQTSHARQSCKGFSLFELMIAIAIIGILAAIVIPNYQGSVRKANAASAVALVVSGQQRPVTIRFNESLVAFTGPQVSKMMLEQVRPASALRSSDISIVSTRLTTLPIKSIALGNVD